MSKKHKGNNDYLSNSYNPDIIDNKLRELKDKTATNIHHILGKKERDEYNVEDPRNKIRIRIPIHNAINQLFNVLQTPHEQMRYMWEIHKSVLSAGVNRAIYDILNLPRGMFYKEDLVRWKDRTKSLWKDGWGRG